MEEVQAASEVTAVAAAQVRTIARVRLQRYDGACLLSV